MASAIKGMVSKNKIRYKEDGFDLDLSYISRNIIAMGFPAEKLERFYRNHIDDVVRFFEVKHKERYQIYNLCAESQRRYDTQKFQCRVIQNYAFQDHNPPPFELLKPFCEDVHRWLSQDRNNVIAIHCKAGKGRTGVMICAYLIHTGECEITDDSSGATVKISSAEKALEYYGRHRTHDKKGVTIPSQRRYVYYYEELVKNRLEYHSTPLKLCSIYLKTIPIFNGGAFTLICEIIQLPKQKLKTYEIEVKKGSKFLQYNLPEELVFRGDIKIEFYIKKIKKEKIFQFCFNTFFVKSCDDNNSIKDNCIRTGTESNSDHKKCSTIDCSQLPVTNGYSNGQIHSNSNRKCFERKSSNGKELCLVLTKDQLDKAYKDKTNKTFTADFQVCLTFTKPVHSYSRSPDVIRNENNRNNDGTGSQENGSTDNDSENDTEDEDEDYEDDDEEDNSSDRTTGQTTYL